MPANTSTRTKLKSPADVALVCLKFKFHKILFSDYLVKANLLILNQSREINHALLILSEHWRAMRIQNC